MPVDAVVVPTAWHCSLQDALVGTFAALEALPVLPVRPGVRQHLAEEHGRGAPRPLHRAARRLTDRGQSGGAGCSFRAMARGDREAAGDEKSQGSAPLDETVLDEPARRAGGQRFRHRLQQVQRGRRHAVVVALVQDAPVFRQAEGAARCRFTSCSTTRRSRWTTG